MRRNQHRIVSAEQGTREFYLRWLAGRRGIELPDGCHFRPEGIVHGKETILPMPGYGQLQRVDIDLLDDAGEVVKRVATAIKPNGAIMLDRTAVRGLMGKGNAERVEIPALSCFHGSPIAPGSTLPTPPKLDRRAALAMSADEMRGYLAACRPVLEYDGAAYVDLRDREAMEACAPVEAETATLPEASEELPEAAWLTDPDHGTAEEAPAAEPAKVSPATDWNAFVGEYLGCAPDGWQVSVGKQRDRKARNHGKVVIAADLLATLRETFNHAKPSEARSVPTIVEEIVDLGQRVERLAERVADAPQGNAEREAALEQRVRQLESDLAHEKASRSTLAEVADHLRTEAAEAHTANAALQSRASLAEQRADALAAEVERFRPLIAALQALAPAPVAVAA